MFRKGVFALCCCTAIVFPIAEVKAFWGTEKISPKAERAKKTLEGLDEVVEKSLKDFQIPGVAIGIVVDGSVIYAKGIGYRDYEKKLPITADTKFLIGSCTKAFTSFVIGCLVDEGSVSWDDRIVDLNSDFRLSDQYLTQKLTIRDLLAHRTPLPRHDFMWYNSDLTRQQVFHNLRYLDFDNNPNEQFHYNNLMYLAAAMAVEKAVNKNWEDLVTEKILTPLGMKHTGFSIADFQKASDMAFPYVERDDKVRRMKCRDFKLVGPGACIYSNVNDLCRWVQMQLKHGEWQQKALISSVTLKEMHSPQILATGYPETKEEQVRAYGLGWYVQSYLGHLNIMHDGALDGYTSVVSLLPHENVGIILLCNKNLTAWPRLLALEIFDRLLELPPSTWLQEGLESYLKNREIAKESQAKEELNRKKGTNPSHHLEDYAGEYEHPAYGRVKIECVDGALRALFHNFVFDLEHWHYDVFNVCKESDDMLIPFKNQKFTFRNNVNGDVSELIVPLELKAQDIVFQRKSEDSLCSAAYLRQFVGKYEIYGYCVHIKLTDKGLLAAIPGNTETEMEPIGVNYFSLKNYKGCWVCFRMNENNEVTEAELTTPYGVTYTGIKTE